MTFVAVRGSIRNETIISFLDRHAECELVLIKEDGQLPKRLDRPVVALVQCDQILGSEFVRLRAKTGPILAPPQWTRNADDAVGITAPPKPRRKDPLGKSRKFGTNSATIKALEDMMRWGFTIRHQTA